MIMRTAEGNKQYGVRLQGFDSSRGDLSSQRHDAPGDILVIPQQSFF